MNKPTTTKSSGYDMTEYHRFDILDVYMKKHRNIAFEVKYIHSKMNHVIIS